MAEFVCSVCGEARDEQYTCRQGGESIPASPNPSPDTDLRAALQEAVEALEAIRDHGKTHERPCWALHNGDCADTMQEIARSTLASVRNHLSQNETSEAQ